MKNHVTLCQLGIITLATSSGMHDVVVHLSWHTHSDSPGGSMCFSQHMFWPNNKED